LCEAYERQGRHDLAQCVKKARVHQLLDGFFDIDLYSSGDPRLKTLMPYLNAMQSTLDPNSNNESFTSIPQWTQHTTKKHEKDEGLALVQELDKRNRKAKGFSSIVYPAKRVLGRVLGVARR
jgi:hypothetical protein